MKLKKMSILQKFNLKLHRRRITVSIVNLFTNSNRNTITTNSEPAGSSTGSSATSNSQDSSSYAIDVIIENDRSIAVQPYLITTTNNIYTYGWNSSSTMTLLPEKFTITSTKKPENDDKALMHLIKIVMTDHDITSTRLLNLVIETPTDNITSKYAIFALRTIIGHMNNEKLLNNELQLFLDHPNQISGIQILIDRLSKIGEPYALLEALELLTLSVDQGPMLAKWREQILNTILIDVFDSTFKMNHVIKAIDLLAKYSGDINLYKEKLPLLWFGLKNNEESIDSKNILKLFNYFEVLNQSRPIVLSLIEHNVDTCWQKFNAVDVLFCLQTLRNFQIKNSEKTLRLMAEWFNKNIYRVSSNTFQEILKCFLSTKYNDERVEKAVERYIKARYSTSRDPHLYLQIAIYLTQFRVRNPVILHHLSEMLINDINMFAPYAVKDILHTFGLLSYKPNTEVKFWNVVDSYVAMNFARISIEDLMMILLSYIYMDNYTLKYKQKIFHTEYLNNFCSGSSGSKAALEKLHVYDTAMTLFNDKYHGPMLAKNIGKRTSALYDKDVAKCILKMETHFQTLFKKYAMDFQRFVRLPQMPQLPVYVVDVLAFDKRRVEEPLLVKTMLDKFPGEFRAILIAKPNSYTSDNFIVGSEMMRAKHMNRLGLNVIFLDYNVCMSDEYRFDQIQEYLESMIFSN